MSAHGHIVATGHAPTGAPVAQKKHRDACSEVMPSQRAYMCDGSAAAVHCVSIVPAPAAHRMPALSAGNSLYAVEMKYVACWRPNYADVVRFRWRDDKVLLADLLAALGRYSTRGSANTELLRQFRINDTRLHGLDSLEQDASLLGGGNTGRSVFVVCMADASLYIERHSRARATQPPAPVPALALAPAPVPALSEHALGESNTQLLSALLKVSEEVNALRMRRTPYWTKNAHPELPRNVIYRNKQFRWKLVRRKVQVESKAGFKTIAAASAALRIYKETGANDP